MRKIMLTFAVLFAMGTAMTTFTSCRDTESTGDKIEDAADDVGDAIDAAVD